MELPSVLDIPVSNFLLPYSLTLQSTELAVIKSNYGMRLSKLNYLLHLLCVLYEYLSQQ